MNIARICRVSDFLGQLRKIQHDMELEAFHEEAEMLEKVIESLIKRLNRITGGQQ